MTKPKRSFRDGHKRIVAARQHWTCAQCKTLLSSSFQVDHVIPLFRGGADCISNAEALCACCHAHKTQLEHIARHEAARQKKADEARAAQRAFEATVRAEAYAGRTLTCKNGTLHCSACDAHVYALFGHDVCPAVEEAIAHRITPRRHMPTQMPDDNPFRRFRYCSQNV